jgi:hypothetical protein
LDSTLAPLGSDSVHRFPITNALEFVAFADFCALSTVWDVPPRARGDIDDLDVERGHRPLRVVREGGKRASIPLAPRAARAQTDLAHSLRHSFITAALDAGVREPHKRRTRSPTRARPCVTTRARRSLDRHATRIATPASRVPPADTDSMTG